MRLCPCPNMVLSPSPPHTHMPTPPTGGQLSSSATAEASINRGRGGEGEEPLLNKMADQWMSTRDLDHEGVYMHAYTDTHTCMQY